MTTTPVPLRRQLMWLIASRAAIVTLLLGSATIMQIVWPEARLPIEVAPLVWLTAATYGLTALYVLLLAVTRDHGRLTDLQLAMDTVVVSVIVSLTGGINSYFVSLYSLPIIVASIVKARRGGLLVCSLSSVLYVALVLGQYLRPPGADGVPEQLLPAINLAIYTVSLNVFGFLAIALLTGYLAEGLRQADIRLEQASHEIEDLQALGRHIIDSLTSGLATTDMAGRILTFNRAASAITGVSQAKAVGASAAEVFALSSELDVLFGRHDQRPQLPRVDFGYRRPDGTHVQLGLSTAVLRTPRGEVGFLLTFQDVTQARRLVREALVQQRLAAVGEMAAGIAHEIRNPLASIAGSMQILRQDLALSGDQGELMDIVLRESERLNETIRSFLAYARPQQQTITDVDVRRIVTDTATLLENSTEVLPAHQIVVETPPERVSLDADEGQLRQIVWNLATNGLRAMPEGGRLTLRVHRSGAAESSEVILEVRDEGTGIAAEDIDAIFHPFRTGFTRGTGLGLSIVQRIVADHGGAIRVSSTPGEGTTVGVRFPIRPHGSSEARAGSPAQVERRPGTRAAAAAPASSDARELHPAP